MSSYIDPHIHMISRTTDDLEAMALAGCVAVAEPAFWAGFDRCGPDSFCDYFRQLTSKTIMRLCAIRSDAPTHVSEGGPVRVVDSPVNCSNR